MKLGHKEYNKPTPAIMRKWGDAILAVGTTLTLYTAYMGYKEIVIASALLTCVGKFLTNFFSE